jgi:SAM-dependent methyltransferase
VTEEREVSSSDAFDIVRSGYDRIGTRYRDWSSAGQVRLLFVRRLLERLSPGSVVVDLGCGSGEPATRLLAAEHHVLGVDASFTQLRLAREAVPTGAFVQADMTRVGLRTGSIDAVASFYALGHVPSQQHVPLLEAIAGWLRPGGVLLFSAPMAAGGELDDDWLGVKMFFGG